MHRFFASQSNIDPDNGFIRIMGDDVNHISHALRMKKGEQILLCTGRKEDPVEYLCEIDEIRSDEVRVRILDFQKHARELPMDLYLFQAIPKGDRFETVIEKGVELGVHRIVPVRSSRCIVKLDEKRALKKAARELKRQQKKLEREAKKAEREAKRAALKAEREAKRAAVKAEQDHVYSIGSRVVLELSANKIILIPTSNNMTQEENP